MRLRVEVPDLPTKSRSRNVNRAVRAVLTVRAMKLALNKVVTAEAHAIAALTGGQKAEAERILRETGVSITRTDASTESHARPVGRPN
jgi:hypothetical protein